jgi:2-polyprenyl-3-methyl-5-hydroxy-6-metoxy-1,4-benzoquinol methylase
MEPVEIPREDVPCALCGSREAAVLFSARGQERQGVYVNGVFRAVAGAEKIVRCRDCGLVYVNPRLAATPGITTYSVTEEWDYFQRTREARRYGNEALLQRLERLTGGPGRLLDVGCGDGLLLTQARERGWEPWGLEVSSELVTRVQAAEGLERVHLGTVGEAAYPTAHFDAVALINVIEHLRDPGETIAEIARVTRLGGVVAVHAPNAGSLAARLRGSAWHHLEPYEHFYYFTARTLERMLARYGLVRVSSFALHGDARLKRWLSTASRWLGLELSNGLGLLARKAGP